MTESAETAPVADPLRSVHTTSFPELLAHLGASVLVTTYQAGKLVILRNDGGVLNTHFRNLSKPMGLTVAGGKLAVGCNVDIWEFHNVPPVCAKLDQSGDYPTRAAKHDACFLPRRCHSTGDVQIHEMAWVAPSSNPWITPSPNPSPADGGEGNSELVFVNTAFSCLSIRSEQNSFEPEWRPQFIRKLSPGDNCHLNGLAVHDGAVQYVTALGETDTPGGWRENKRGGGVLIDVDSNEVVARELSMPHSPRWYRDRLWLLESGNGTFGWVDLPSGCYQPLVELPGFTRGLSFAGPWAFVGLSQVRESAIFSGIPLVERLDERICGVWVVNIETGQVVAFCRFEDAVQEIFAVEVLPGVRFPDLINHDAELIGRSFVLSDAALCDVPAELHASGAS